jgi:hypothetical protein
MPSPFPGMNPYLEHEDAWHNFHIQFPNAVIAALVPQVRPKYFVKADEQIYIHELPNERSRLAGRSDVFVGQSDVPAGSPRVGGVVTAASGQVLLPAIDPLRLPFVEVRDRRSRRLVTLIELLSPSNKRPGADRHQYELKRANLLAGQAHFIEIDLLRGWARMPALEEVASDYCVLVSRYSARPTADIWRFGLRDPLPRIPVPLLEGDRDAVLDLKAILDRLYDEGGYDEFIYQTEPVPPLSPADAAWAESLIPAGVPRHA